MLNQMKNSFIYILTSLFLFGCTTQTFIGEEYLGAKYMNSPLGEGKAPDTDPLIRFDAFDCTTFVETALAHGDINKLNQIRYKDGNIDFLSRNHFTETDWLNNNKNLLENVSDLYGKTEIRTVVNDKQNWFLKTHNIKTNLKPQRAEIKYIPYKNIDTIETKETLVVLFIYNNPNMYDKIGSDLAVSHMGFLLPNGQLRHASKTYGRVMDTDFNKYIRQMAKNEHNIGITLVKIK